MYVCMYACTYVCMYACMFACMHVACVHECVYMQVCMYGSASMTSSYDRPLLQLHVRADCATDGHEAARAVATEAVAPMSATCWAAPARSPSASAAGSERSPLRLALAVADFLTTAPFSGASAVCTRIPENPRASALRAEDARVQKRAHIPREYGLAYAYVKVMQRHMPLMLRDSQNV